MKGDARKKRRRIVYEYNLFDKRKEAIMKCQLDIDKMFSDEFTYELLFNHSKNECYKLLQQQRQKHNK